MSHYTAPKWDYEYGQSGRGQNLRLLSISEVFICGDLLKKWLRPSSSDVEKTWYKSIVNDNDYDKQWLYCNRLINNIKKCDEQGVNDFEMNALNEQINRIFSDLGWREMKKKFRQQIKRTQTIRPEISITMAKALSQFKDDLGLKSLDEAVDYLLSFYKDNNEHFNENEDR